MPWLDQRRTEGPFSIVRPIAGWRESYVFEYVSCVLWASPNNLDHRSLKKVWNACSVIDILATAGFSTASSTANGRSHFLPSRLPRHT